LTRINTAATAAISAALMVAALAPAAAASQHPNAVAEWSRVERLTPGSEITLVLRSSGASKCRVTFANTVTLVVLRFLNPKPPGRVLQALKAIGPQWTAVLAGGITYTSGSVLVSRDGIFDDAVKLADVVGIPRDDVVEIRGTVRRGSVVGAVLGASAGGVIGFFSAMSLAFKQCGGSCNDEQTLMMLSLVGLPVGGGLLGYYGGGRTSAPVTIYRAPQAEALVLDDAMWQRVRQALPPSLRGRNR
jgi:uncharacterized protein YqgC (DUF456 family)